VSREQAEVAVGNWGRWGEDDERGAANLIDALAVRRAAACVRTGEVISLALELRSGQGSPAVGRPPLQHFMLRDGGDYATGKPERGGFGFADDAVLMATHGATHLDALSHVWRDGRMYNGFAASQVTSSGAKRCGIDKVGPLITRAILADMVPAGRVALDPGEPVGVGALRAAVEAAGVGPEPGDALLVRTGWSERWRDGAVEADSWPGLDRDCAAWIGAQDFALVGADNIAVEVFPSSDPDCQVPLHIALLRDRGIYLAELLDLRALAATGRRVCMLMLAPLPLRGAVGSPVNPVAVL
jgi:kynurenine formamidase